MIRLQEKSFPWKVIPEKSYPENSYPLKIHTLKSHTLKTHSLSEAILYYYKFAINLVKIHNRGILHTKYVMWILFGYWFLDFFYKYLLIIIISKRGWVFRVWVFRGYEFSGYEFSVYQFSGNQFRGNDFSCSRFHFCPPKIISLYAFLVQNSRLNMHECFYYNI